MGTTGTMTRGLRGLGPSGLEVLLARRPEAAEALAAAGAAPTVGLLASALAERRGVRRAIESLDLFLLQLLRVASWLGPEVPGSALAAQVDGAAPEQVRAAAGDLARWGLAFPHDSDEASGWALSVPGAVRVEVPPALGRHAAELLAGEPAEGIRAILIRLGVEPPRPATRDALMALLTARLGNREALASVLDRAPAAARAVLEGFVAAGGTLTWEEMPRHGIRFGMPSGPGDDPGLGVAWLRQAGLLVVTAAGTWRGGAGLTVPGEAQLALRDGIVFRGWEPRPPAIEHQPLPPAIGTAGDAAALLSAVQAVLDEWTHRPPRAVQKGGAGVRDVRKVARSIGVDERHGQFLYALAVEAGLLEYREDHVVPSPEAQRWRGDPPPRQWATLFEAWLRGGLWLEPAGLVPMDEVSHPAAVEGHRRAILEALAELPPGAGAEAGQLARLVHWRRPLATGSVERMARFAGGVAEVLAWLGTGTPGPVIALLDPGRSVLRDGAWSGSAEVAALFPEPVATLTVQPDFTILVPGRPAPGLSRDLAAFAELQASSPARIYRVTEASIRGALDAGMTSEEITDLLHRHARAGVPQSVAYLIEDVARQHGRLVVGRGGLFVRSDDPSVIAAVVADRRLARLRPRALAPTVAVFGGGDLAKLLKALRSAGYMPVAEPDHDDEDESVDLQWAYRRHSDGHPILYRHPDRGRRTPPAPEIARIAAAVADDASRPPRRDAAAPAADTALDGRLCRSPRDIRRLVELALDHDTVLEIQYLSGAGDTTVREIEPLEYDRSSVTAYCRLREDRRTFHIPRIRWARATGETFDREEALLATFLRKRA